MKLSSFGKFFIDAIFPKFCLGCGKEGELVCQDCISTIEILEYQFCPFCKTQKRVFEKGTCKNHRKKYLNGLFAATSLDDPLVKKLIHNFKYSPFLKELSKPLAYLIISHFLLSENKLIHKKNNNKDLIIPVPLTNLKKRQRGFNQSELIANQISTSLKAAVVSNILIRQKKTMSQTSLSENERKENIKNAFFVKTPEKINGKRIFLVDDVFTTGATMEECSKTLKNAGAKEVWGIVVAREMLKF